MKLGKYELIYKMGRVLEGDNDKTLAEIAKIVLDTEVTVIGDHQFEIEDEE